MYTYGLFYICKRSRNYNYDSEILEILVPIRVYSLVVPRHRHGNDGDSEFVKTAIIKRRVTIQVPGSANLMM